MAKVSDIVLKEAQEKAHKQYVKMVKSHVLDFLKERPVYRLSELWEQRGISPLDEMSMEEFKSFLSEQGYKLVEIKDYQVCKK